MVTRLKTESFVLILLKMYVRTFRYTTANMLKIVTVEKGA